MSRGPEGKIQDAVVKYARFRGVLHRKNEVGRYFISSGWPDHNFFPGKGRVFFIEFKAPGKDFTELQAQRAKELREAGYHVYLVDDKEQGKKIIDKECKT